MFKETVSNKKKFLSSLVKAPMAQIEQGARTCWSDPDQLGRLLSESLCRLPHCQLLYAVQTNGIQYTGNITRNGTDNTWQGRDLSQRPFLNGNLPFRGMILSAAYLSQRSMQPCITTVQAVNDGEHLLGFIAADFHLKDLPIMNTSTLQRMHLQRSQHHPSFGQSRKTRARHHSDVDENIDYLIYAISSLMQEHGVFHCKLHFDAGRCNLWSFDEPHDYRLHSIEEIMSSTLFDHYPTQDYHSKNRVKPEQIPLVLAQFKALRQADDNVYLSSGSLNLVNGRVTLAFSCDGTHYITVDEFLNQELGYWLDGKESANEPERLKNSTPN